MSWQYQQSTGNLTDPDGNFIQQGYAGGNCGKNPEGRNDPDAQQLHDIGPLPRGIYLIEAPVEHTKLGPFALPLKPSMGNEMFGRSAFFMHGDLIEGPPGSASDGCIIMARETRERVAESDDDELEVIA